MTISYSYNKITGVIFLITYVVGDLLKSPARVLVNTVNTVGAMGKGIAKDFKNIYPEMFVQYQQLCEKGAFDVGQLWLYKTKHKWILNFPTKKHWRGSSKIEYIEAGLKKFVETYSEKGISSISFPMLGCGHGGLDWENEVRPLMEKYLKNLPIDIYIHLYRKDPFQQEHKNIKEIQQWLRNNPESLSFFEVWEDINKLIAEKDSFFTINNNIGFVAKIIKEPNHGILIKSAEQEFIIFKEQFVDLWQHLRSLGFCMENSMPFGLEKYTPFIVAILSHLTYLKPVIISSDYKKIDTESIGLQLIPNSTLYSLFNLEDSLNEVEFYE